MSRLVPKSYIIAQENEREEREQREKVQQRKSAKEAAIERARKRESILNSFCKEFKIDSEGELCKSIKKIFRNPATKNIPLAEYKKELDLIGNTLPTIGLDRMTIIVTTNASRGYKYLIYENQLINPFKKKKIAKDNIQENKTSATTKTAKLSDFNGYRHYLTNEHDDEELKAFVRKEFGIEVVE